MEMINIINQNKSRKQEMIKKQNIKELKKQERISYIFTLCGYIIATIVFVEIVTLLVK